MPTVSVNNFGAVFFHEDTGAPAASSDYLTIVIVHGLAFHEAGFRYLFSHARAHNIRVITLNLRDYPGSTPYTESEMERLQSHDVCDIRDASRAQGLELATFLQQIILSEKLPRKKFEGGATTGGIALLSWSLGNACTFSMLANEDSLSNDTKILLQASIRSIVVYDVPHIAIGLPLPLDIRYPGNDPSVTPEQFPIAFGGWATAFYYPIAELTSDTLAIRSRNAMHEISPDPQYTPLFTQLPWETLATIADPSVLERSEKNLMTKDPIVARENCERALFDVRPESSFADIDALFIWGDMTIANAIYATSHLAERFKEAESAGDGKIRKARFVKIKDANHFIHWYEPEKFIQLLVRYL